MKVRISACLLTALFTFAVAPCVADDFGPQGDVNTARADARILLAHQARLAGIDPKMAAVSDVVVSKDTALLSWRIGLNRGVLGLMREDSRWWGTFAAVRRPDGWQIQSSAPFTNSTGDMEPALLTASLLKSYGFSDDLLEAAIQHNANVSAARPIIPQNKYTKKYTFEPTAKLEPVCPSNPCGTHIQLPGGTVTAWGSQTGGYAFSMTYASNDASEKATFSQVYGRAPTQAEFLPYPTPSGFYSSDAVFFFDLTIDAPNSVTFAKASRIFVWFPFVLDDTLRYNLSIGFADKPIGPIFAKVFDNTLEFELPAFTVTPGKQLMAEIDGDR